MLKRNFYIILLLLISQLTMAQTINVFGIERFGRFQSCGNSTPTINATLLYATGATVQDGAVAVTDPCGFTTMRVTMSNLQWNQTPGANWFHGVFFPANSGITISGVVMPAGWAAFDSCTGASCSNQTVGGPGFYFDGTVGNSCAECFPTLNDGIPSNNYGDINLDCGDPFSIQFDMTFCNSQIETTTLEFTLMGTADGNTGCWSTSDSLDNRILFSINTVASEDPIFSPPANNAQVITECVNGNEFNYIAELVGGCGNDSEITWWDAPVGGNMIGQGSPFMYDPPGDACPGGTTVYAQCCPEGTICDSRKAVVISQCLPLSDTPTFDPIPAQCPGSPSPLPSTSLEGVVGTWSPAWDPNNSGTYTFLPNPGQCLVYPTSVTVEIQTVITPTFPLMAPICQNTTAPDLPSSNEGVTGTWSPAVIDTTTPGTFQYTFTPDSSCSEEVVIDVTINPSIIPDFVLDATYCSSTEIITLPVTSDNGFPGTWVPAIVDTSVVGTQTYTFTPGGSGDCVIPFQIDIEVEQSIIPTFVNVEPICQNATAPVLPQPNEGITGTWVPAVISTTTAGTFDYTFTADMECSEPVTIQVVIVPDVAPEFVIDNSYCQFETPQVLNPTSDNGVPGIWSPAVIDTTTPGITVYTFTPQGSLCSSATSITVEVFAEPVLNAIPVQLLCDEDLDGMYVINLTSFNAQLGGGTGIAYSYYASQTDLNNDLPIAAGQLNNYQMQTLPVTIYAVGESAQSCRSEAIAIQINQGPTVQYSAGPFGPIEYCPEDTVDLTQYEGAISPSNGVNYGYYNTLDNARFETAEILNPEEFVPSNNQTSVYVRLDESGLCSAIVEIKLEKLTTPSLELESLVYLCNGENYEVTATSNDPNATFQWTLEDGTVWNGATQTISAIGNYTVIAYSADGCRSETRVLTVSLPSVPQIVSIDASGNSITVGATNNGQGPMEYSLDGVFWQSSNVFTNVVPGETYTVYVRNKGCVVSKETVTMLLIPNFFSPNGDGINETWEIRGIQVTPNATLKIFDRYGKIFVDTNFEGNYVWDGKYGGRTVASGDYWYIIHIPADGVVTEKKFTGHVSVRNR